MSAEFERFFQKAMGASTKPYPYQVELATVGPTIPSLVNVPTGLGKTAAVVLAWLWRRRFADEQVRTKTPRRLVYCLPMRVLVEQTRASVDEWLENVGSDCEIGIHVLMGGEAQVDWDLHPERDAILIGTQDMLLSRVLNRGYGMSPFRWPMHFGLLGSDCMWVFDEVQLMDVGVATSAQLEGFRRSLGAMGPTRSVWMSATLRSDWLDTVDFELEWLGEPVALSSRDRQLASVRERYEASKPIEKASVPMGDTESVAKTIVDAHSPGSLTLAVFNRVDRAREVYRFVRDNGTEARVVLIHSQFRPGERNQKMAQLLEAPSGEGTIAISTQVVEAGVDVSARMLFTELAPWASLVQRFGRCNRRGEFNNAKTARIYWFDATDEAFDEHAMPYEAGALVDARRCLEEIVDAAPASLDNINVSMEMEPAHVIRRRDFLDLFDTTPDLAGNDIDVSRFIRSGEELDVQVFWRDVPEGTRAPTPDSEAGLAPGREELCPAPVFGKRGFREFVKKHQGDVWCWSGLDDGWTTAQQDRVFPGQVFLVRSDAGGYDSELGWDAQGRKKVESIAAGAPPKAYDRDFESGPWQSISTHTEEVVAELETILSSLSLDEVVKQTLLDAATRHDWGKAHEVFQDALPDPAPEEGVLWGKAAGKWKRYARPRFRHELASALAMLQAGLDDLAVYLVAAHHGKVRLSIRSFPGEEPPPGDAKRLFARGIWDGDQLAEVQLGNGVVAAPVRLSLRCMQLGRSGHGQPSWAERMLKLRDDPELGPFRLAYLEALLRAADMRASRNADRQASAQKEVVS